MTGTNSRIDELIAVADILRQRHADILRTCFGKSAEPPHPTKEVVQRVLICDAAEGETVLTDTRALLKLVKTDRKKVRHLRNKILSAAMRTGKVVLENRETNFPSKTDLEVITIVDKETQNLIDAYTDLIRQVKAEREPRLN